MGFGRGCFFMDPNPKMMEFVENIKRYAQRTPKPGQSWAMIVSTSSRRPAKRQKRIETEAVIKAMEGMTFDSLRGKITIRALDHMGSVPCYQGVIAKDPAYPFKIWKDIDPRSRRPGLAVRSQCA